MSISTTAFTTAPVTSIATRDAPARRTIRTATPSTRRVLGVGQSRRVRVAPRRTSKPIRTSRIVPETTPTDKPAHVAEPPTQLEELHAEQYVADPITKSEPKPANDVAIDEKSRRSKRKLEQKARKQKAYLDEQLEKRQKENDAKKGKKPAKQTQKRTRSSTRTSPNVRKSGFLKDTFQAYMDEISREELLDQAEVIKLALQIRKGGEVEITQREMERSLGRRPSVPELAKEMDVEVMEVQKRLMSGTAAKNSLVAANLRLVTSVARKVASSKGASTAGLALDDMVQEGSVGLIRAAEKYDVTRGYRFSTYATWWIRAYVMRSITTQSRTIKVPTTIVEEYARIRKEYSRLRTNGSFKPADAEVARGLGITPAKLRFVVKVVTQVPASLDVNIDANSDSINPRSLGEIVEGEDNLEERLVEDFQRSELDAALRSCLKPIERATIRLRFGLDDGQPRTLREVGDVLGLSKERVRQLIFRSLPKLKTPEIQRMLTDATAR